MGTEIVPRLSCDESILSHRMSALESVIDIRLTVIRGSMSSALAGPAARAMTHSKIIGQTSGNPLE